VKDELRKDTGNMEKNHGKRWKILRLIYINLLYANFFIVIKNCKKSSGRQELLPT